MGKFIKKINSMGELVESGLTYPNVIFCAQNNDLKFYPYGIPNKLYDASNFSGFGVKYIQKNIVNDANVLTQEVFNTSNTIYVIEFDFTLNSGITIPSNCVLSFKGGSISGGSITFNKTYIDGDAIFDNTLISGSCSNEILTPAMFGARPALVETESNKSKHTIGFKNLANVINDENTSSKFIYIPSGHYAINERVMFMSSCEVRGCGETTVIDCYDGAGAISFGFTTTGDHYYSTCEQLNCTITEDVNKLDDYITVDSTSEINPNDYIIITDSQDKSFNSSRAYYRMSEFAKVIKIENNKVYLANKLYGYYSAAFGDDYVTTLSPVPSHRTIISKFIPKQYNIHDLYIIGHEHNNENPSSYYTLTVCGFEDSVFSGIKIENYGNKVACCLKLGINYSVDGCVFRNYATYTTDAYGLVINNSQDFNVRNSKFTAPSHALSTGGGSSPYDTINRNFIYEKLYFEYNKNDLNVSSGGKIDLDVHGDSEYYKFDNIVSPSTICDCGGYNVTIENCKLYRITVSFNESDVTVRNCEIFTDSTTALVWNENTRYNLSNNSIIFDNCKFHGNLTINYQSSDKTYDNFIFKNNNCGALQLRNGKVNNVVIENNSFKEGGKVTTHNIVTINLSVKHNTFLDGVLWVVSEEKGKCIITDNFIKTKTLPSSAGDTQCVYLKNLEGYFTNNIVIRDIANYHTPIMIESGEIKVNNNIFKLSDNGLNKQLIKSYNSNVILENNMHNSISKSLISTSEDSSSVSATSFGFSDYYSDLRENVDRLSIKSAIGNTFYDEKTNRLAYGSICVGGTDIKNFTTSAKTYIDENIFKPSQFYFTSSGGYGEHELYLSKYNDLTNPDFESGLLLIHTFSYDKKPFQVPINSNEYPYFYTKTSKEVFVRIYPSRAASEYDGASFRVKRSGTTAERPNGYDIYVGFVYIDTDLGKPIYAKAIQQTYYTVTWVDANGTTV